MKKGERTIIGFATAAAFLREVGIFEQAIDYYTSWCPKCSEAWCYSPKNHPNRCPECGHVLAVMVRAKLEPPSIFD
jgi:DNA-directed RNA polymerase subunit RPC12/RpoP